MCDLLLKSAQVYDALMKVQYRLLLGKKGKLYSMGITFPADGYHHLAGFQYATGVWDLRNKQEALLNVLTGKVTTSTLIDHGCFEEIENRFRAICQIPDLMRENRFVFYYKGTGPNWSRIDAKYLMTYGDESIKANYVHFFVNGDDISSMVPASSFICQPGKYTRNCPRMAALEIVLIEGEQETVLFRSPSLAN